ncbi:hypothetical protein [Photorhabdus heterorhabditis]|uniref:Uncharacterized protein n=1 Tax=Photorhabdus heterorhabditis TaxID=880156 RepID=A0A5B0VKJ3_9GAMM|nr:hypothetical protein [Photorhabdus heterorhabditis]KAA1174615.1 hypothetical protein F0L16_20855 [Photorhabdus heterorhabditis]
MGFDIENELRKAFEQKNDFDLRVQEAHRVSALAVERALEDVADMGVEIIETIGLGIKREFYKTSYFFEGYEDVYEKIKKEDKRMFLNLANLKNEYKFIYRIIESYVNEVFEGFDEEVKKRIYLNILKFSAKLSTGQSVKTGITMVVVEMIYLNVIKNVMVKNLAKKAIGGIVTLAQVYGYVEKASMAADRLKVSCPKLYWVLFFKKLEMLYFIVEPILEKGLYLIDPMFKNDSNKKGYFHEEEIARVIASMIDN